MEGVAPILILMYKLRSYLELNLSIRAAISDFIRDPMNCSQLRRDIIIWTRSFDQGQAELGPYLQKSPYRMNLVSLLERGLEGAPIQSDLDLLIKEVGRASIAEIEFETGKIPFFLMIPTFFLLVPAFLLILFVPLLREFSRLLA